MTREEIREMIEREIKRRTDPYKYNDGRIHFYSLVDQILHDLHSQGVVIKGQSLGVTHPHLASYYTVENLIDA